MIKTKEAKATKAWLFSYAGHT